MPKQKTLITRIKNFWEKLEEIDEWLHLQKSNINRVLDYIPVLWKDKDFDYIFVLQILRFKLNRMMVSMNQGFPSSQVVASEIKIAIDMIDEILEKDERAAENLQGVIEELFVYIAVNIQGWWE